MGFSVAAAAAILFAGAILSFAIVLESIEAASDTVADARTRDDERRLAQLNTHISLVNGTANGTVVDLNLTNNGSSVIHINRIDVLVNGTLYTENITLKAVDGVSGTGLWSPGQTLHLQVAAPVGAPASVKIVTEVGYEFYVRVS
jgi:archaellum component FlaF (FlaF/FlaG flagellin family)